MSLPSPGPVDTELVLVLSGSIPDSLELPRPQHLGTMAGFLRSPVDGALFDPVAEAYTGVAGKACSILTLRLCDYGIGQVASPCEGLIF